MGSGASIDHSVEERYRQELSKLFASEFEKLSNSGFTGAELEEHFISVLRSKDSTLKQIITSISPNPTDKDNGDGQNEADGEEDSTIDFRDLCQQTVEMIRMKYAMTFLVAVDGSETSDLAFQQAMAFRKRNDHICLFHAFSSLKDQSLPVQYKKDEIRSRYESQLVALMSSQKYSFCWRERCVFTAEQTVNRTWSAKEMLSNLLNEYTRSIQSRVRNPLLPTQNPPDFCFLGYTGRKGSQIKRVLGVPGYESIGKSHNHTTPPTTFGSVADFAMRNIHVPCVICKYAVEKDRPRRFMIAVDDSELSKRGFDLLLTLIRPNDSLVCLHIFKGGKQNDSQLGANGSKDVQIYFEAECARIGPVNSSVVMLMHDSTVTSESPDGDGGTLKGQHIGEQLVKYVNEIANPPPDYLAIAPRARVDNDGLSSVTEYIILRVESNIILCKN